MPQDKEQSITQNSRRGFIKTTALAAAGFMILPRHVLGGERIFGAGRSVTTCRYRSRGKGESDIANIVKGGKTDVAFLCDVDDRRAATSVKNFPKAKYYKDYRELLDKEAKHIDAVTVSTPDHNHAMIAMAAMQLGKHIYVQKAFNPRYLRGAHVD
jgi:predicted dehydrogenase